MRAAGISIMLAASLSLSAATPSGTLPLLTIETENRAAVPAKTEPYVSATYTLSANGCEGVENMSGETQIRGRGNYTWTGFDKKPYRLKLTKKTKLMGFNASKHFVLLAHADDDLGFMREPMGFWLSQRLGLAWTPGMKPVELMLNGDYVGLYFLVENIKVAKDRVNIFDQEEEAEESGASSDITGGWLCEIDNYQEDPSEQITLTESNGAVLRVTHKSPEAITGEQETWLRDQITAIDKAFYQQDPENRDWQELVDIESLARFYVLQELMDGHESFHGSCYLHRDRGADKKWIWGPVWDFGSTFCRTDRRELIYENPTWGQTWVGEIVKFTDFQNAYKKVFRDFVLNDLDDLFDYLDNFAATIADAAVCDHARWRDKGYGTDDVMERLATIKGYLKARIGFLRSRWDIDDLPAVPGLPGGIYLRGVHSNWNATEKYEFLTTERDNIFELCDVDVRERFKVADASWGGQNWGGQTDNIRMSPDSDQPMVAGGGSHDIYFDGHVAQAIFTVTDPGRAATIRFNSTHSGLDDITTDTDSLFTVTGNTISSSGKPVSIYTLSGATVADSVTAVTLPPGFYIVRQGSRSTKVIIR